MRTSSLRNLHPASISKRGLSWALQMPGPRDSVDLDERISTIGTLDAKWRSTIGVISITMRYHGEERSETALQLVLLDAPLKVRRDK